MNTELSDNNSTKHIPGRNRNKICINAMLKSKHSQAVNIRFTADVPKGENNIKTLDVLFKYA